MIECCLIIINDLNLKILRISCCIIANLVNFNIQEINKLIKEN